MRSIKIFFLDLTEKLLWQIAIKVSKSFLLISIFLITDNKHLAEVCHGPYL